MPFQTIDRQNERFARNLDQVLTELERTVTGIVAGAMRGNHEATAAAILLNSREEMLRALTDAGYRELAQRHVEAYPDIVQSVLSSFTARELPSPDLTTADTEIFRQLAQADLEQFKIIGESALDELRLDLYRVAITGLNLDDAVERIRDKLEGPLKNYAKTYANTASLNFSGQVAQRAGEDLDAELWRVVGPDDSVTRDVCEAALKRPIRTKEEWIEAGYWGGTPGGWNCRHILYPYFGALDEIE